MPKEAIEDYNVIIGYLNGLNEAMEEMDIDAMDEMMAKIEAFDYQPDVQADIEKLGVLVINMDNEQAALLIEEIINKINPEGDMI